jgi:hypothetical protein
MHSYPHDVLVFVIIAGAPLDHLPTQFVLINVPALSPWEWHPISISSAPGDSVTTHHIKVIEVREEVTFISFFFIASTLSCFLFMEHMFIRRAAATAGRVSFWRSPGKQRRALWTPPTSSSKWKARTGYLHQCDGAPQCC